MVLLLEIPILKPWQVKYYIFSIYSIFRNVQKALFHELYLLYERATNERHGRLRCKTIKNCTIKNKESCILNKAEERKCSLPLTKSRKSLRLLMILHWCRCILHDAALYSLASICVINCIRYSCLKASKTRSKCAWFVCTQSSSTMLCCIRQGRSEKW